MIWQAKSARIAADYSWILIMTSWLLLSVPIACKQIFCSLVYRQRPNKMYICVARQCCCKTQATDLHILGMPITPVLSLYHLLRTIVLRAWQSQGRDKGIADGLFGSVTHSARKLSGPKRMTCPVQQMLLSAMTGRASGHNMAPQLYRSISMNALHAF